MKCSEFKGFFLSKYVSSLIYQLGMLL